MKIAYFDPNMRADSKIILVGAGGTGAQIARGLARMLWHRRQKNLSEHDLIIIDHDTVEEHNIGRQLFAPADIGRNKAEALATRFNLALGLQIRYVPDRFHPENIDAIVDSYRTNYNIILIGAVDNTKARADIHLMATNKSRWDHLIWIDAGNTRTGGQVIIGNSNNTSDIHRGNHGAYYDELPWPSLVMPQLLEPDEDETGLSCAQLQQRELQGLFVNDWMALPVIQLVYKLLYREPIYSAVTWLDTNTMSMRSQPLTVEAA